MSMCGIESELDIQHLLEDEKAVLCVYVEWAHQAVSFKKVFEAIAAQSDYEGSNLSFYTVDEDAELSRGWLSSLGIWGVAGETAFGSGVIVWFAQGQVVRSLIHAHKVDENQFSVETQWAYSQLS